MNLKAASYKKSAGYIFEEAVYKLRSELLMEKPISEMTTEEMAKEYVKERMARCRKSESDKAEIERYIKWLYNLR